MAENLGNDGINRRNLLKGAASGAFAAITGMPATASQPEKVDEPGSPLDTFYDDTPVSPADRLRMIEELQGQLRMAPIAEEYGRKEYTKTKIIERDFGTIAGKKVKVEIWEATGDELPEDIPSELRGTKSLMMYTIVMDAEGAPKIEVSFMTASQEDLPTNGTLIMAESSGRQTTRHGTVYFQYDRLGGKPPESPTEVEQAERYFNGLLKLLTSPS